MTEPNEIYYPNIKQSWGILGIVILFCILFAPINLVLDKLVGKELTFLIYYLFSMGIPFLIFHLIRKKRTGVSHYNFALSNVMILALVSIVTISIQMGVTTPIINLFPMPEFIKNAFIEMGQQNGVFGFVLIVIAAPIIEELIFRGIILHGLLKRYSPVKSIIVSSILFGIAHLNPWQFIAAFIIGVFSGWVYFKTNKILLSIIIHSVNNLVGFLSMYIMDAETLMDISLTDFYGGNLNLILVIVVSVILALSCIYILNTEFEKEKEDGITQNETAIIE